jgi:hypothetical protein
MASGKEQYRTLRELFRLASSRRFRTKNRNNRYAEIIGFGPNGDRMIGWWEGTDTALEFDPDERAWTNPTIYV